MWHPNQDPVNRSKRSKGSNTPRGPRLVSEWLVQCEVDLHGSGVTWSLDDLDRSKNLREESHDSHDRCVTWRIFYDERAERLPSVEHFVLQVNESHYHHARQGSEPFALKGRDLVAWKVDLLAKKRQDTRLLNTQVKQGTIGGTVKRYYRQMVEDKAREFFLVGQDCSVDVYNAEANVTPRGTATEVHHDSDPHISTVCGWADYTGPAKLWLIWDSSEISGLSKCYSDTSTALRRLSSCGYLIQHAGESLMLPANTPHAAISLSSHALYGNTFRVQDRSITPRLIVWNVELRRISKQLPDLTSAV